MYKNYNYYSKEFPSISLIPTEHVVNQIDFDNVLSGNLKLYVTGEIIYQNPQNKKPKSYKFCIELLTNPTQSAMFKGQQSRFIYNDNDYLR